MAVSQVELQAAIANLQAAVAQLQADIEAKPVSDFTAEVAALGAINDQVAALDAKVKA